MEESTIIVGLPVGKLEDMIAGAVLTGLRVFHNGKERGQDSDPEGTMSRADTAKMLKVTLPTLDKYARTGALKKYRIGNRILFKRSEVLNGLEQLRTAKQEHK